MNLTSSKLDLFYIENQMNTQHQFQQDLELYDFLLRGCKSGIEPIVICFKSLITSMIFLSKCKLQSKSVHLLYLNFNEDHGKGISKSNVAKCTKNAPCLFTWCKETQCGIANCNSSYAPVFMSILCKISRHQ